MEPGFGILAVISCAGLGQAAVLGVALASRRNAPQRDRLLGLLCLSIAAFILGAVLLSTRAILRFPNLSFVHDPIEFTSAPLLYLYCRSSQTSAPPLRWRDSWHFLPALVCFCILVPWYVQPASAKLPVLVRAYQYGLPWFAWRSAAVLGLAVGYLAVLVFPTGQRALAFSGIRQRLLIWLALAALTLGGMRLLSLYGVFDALQLQENLVIPLLASCVMSYFVLTALRQPAQVAREQSKSAPPAKPVRDPASEQLRAKLLDLMEKQQTFREPRLNLHQLAERAGVPPRSLSELVNREFGQNVTDFINRYRIEEAKRLLLDPRYDSSTLLALAEDVGFGSKSSFNLTFKKHTSMTPSEFRAAGMS